MMKGFGDEKKQPRSVHEANGNLVISTTIFRVLVSKMMSASFEDRRSRCGRLDDDELVLACSTCDRILRDESESSPRILIC